MLHKSGSKSCMVNMVCETCISKLWILEIPYILRQHHHHQQHTMFANQFSNFLSGILNFVLLSHKKYLKLIYFSRHMSNEFLRSPNHRIFHEFGTPLIDVKFAKAKKKKKFNDDLSYLIISSCVHCFINRNYKLNKFYHFVSFLLPIFRFFPFSHRFNGIFCWYRVHLYWRNDIQ